MSTVSFTVKQYSNIFANNNDGAQVNILTKEEAELRIIRPDDEERNETNTLGTLAGLEWIGDADNEKIFGTSWQDNLFGGDGNDYLYGMEGGDWISGGDGVDRIFGGGGDDRIVTGYDGGFPTDNADNPLTPNPDDVDTPLNDGPPLTVGDGDFASGGSGNDILRGD